MISPEKLRRFPLFAGVDPALLKDIAMVGEEVAFDEGEWLFIEGDDANALYLVLGGSLELKIDLNQDGTRRADLLTLTEGSVAYQVLMALEEAPRFRAAHRMLLPGAMGTRK